MVAEFLAEHIRLPNLAQDVLLVIDEAMTNVVRHSYAGEVGHSVHMGITLREVDPKHLWRLDIEIIDQGTHGRTFDPAERLDIAKTEAGRSTGFGVVLMHRLMDDVAYQVTDEGENRLKLGRWFCNARVDLDYVLALVAELQRKNIIPAVNHSTLDELVNIHSDLEVADLLQVLGTIKRVDSHVLRKGVAEARLTLASGQREGSFGR